MPFFGFFRKQKKKFYFIIGAILVVFLILIFRNGNSEEQTIVAKLGDFKNQVSVSGKVIPASSVDLAFKNSGRVEKIYFSVDQLAEKKQTIKAGTLLAKIEAKGAIKDLHDAEVDLAEAKLALAKAELENSAENMNTDLQKAYDDGFVAVSDAFLNLSSSIEELENILEEDNVSDNLVRNSGQTASNYKENAERLFYKANNAFKENRKNFRLLDRNSSKIEIEKIINETYDTTKIFMDAFKSAKNLVDYLSEDTDVPSNYTDSKSILSENINSINNSLSDLLSIKVTIKDKQDVFVNTDLDTQSLLLSIKQKENNLREAQSDLEDYYIRAPFHGIITNIDVKVGEIVSVNTPVISMMGLDTFQIESFIPEVSISLVKLNDEANVNLDAYGSEINFPAKVVSIDPAETIRDGVSTYKVKLQFIEDDERIKSGMTANVLIIAFNKNNTIVLPEGVIFEKDSLEINQKFIQVKKDNKIIDVPVQIGDKTSLGQVEILSGIFDGDIIILNPKIK